MDIFPYIRVVTSFFIKKQFPPQKLDYHFTNDNDLWGYFYISGDSLGHAHYYFIPISRVLELINVFINKGSFCEVFTPACCKIIPNFIICNIGFEKTDDVFEWKFIIKNHPDLCTNL